MRKFILVPILPIGAVLTMWLFGTLHDDPIVDQPREELIIEVYQEQRPSIVTDDLVEYFRVQDSLGRFQ